MNNLAKQYKNVCDRIYLNELALKKVKSTHLKAQLERDYKLREELEKSLKDGE